MLVEETCKNIPANALLKYQSDDSSVSIASLDAYDEPSKDPMGDPPADETITLDIGTAVLMAGMPTLAVPPVVAPIDGPPVMTEEPDDSEATTTFTGAPPPNPPIPDAASSVLTETLSSSSAS
jgi:hypothetical protein